MAKSYDAKKLTRLQQEARMLNAQYTDLRQQRDELRNHLRHIEDADRSTSWYRPRDDSQQASHDAEMEQLRGELSHLEQRMQEMAERQNAISPIVNRLTEWVDAGGALYADYERPDPKAIQPRRGWKKLKELRERIEAVIERLDAVDEAPLPSAEAKAEVDRFIERQFDSNPTEQMAHQALAPDQVMSDEWLRPPTLWDGNEVPLAKYLVWLDPEGVREKLYRSIDALADDARALPADRRSQRRNLEEELKQLGTDEEGIIVGLEAAGESVQRRADADPEVVLEVRETDMTVRHKSPPLRGHFGGGEAAGAE